MTKTLLSLGHGFSAQALADRLVPKGWRVIGTTRKPEKFVQLEAQGVEPLLWPSDIRQALAEATHLLTSAGPDAEGDPILREAYEAITKAAPKLVLKTHVLGKEVSCSCAST